MAEAAISSNYAESVCEIKSMENSLVAIGRVKTVEDNVVKIYSPKKELPLLNFGDELKINIFNTELGFKVIVGKVFTANEELLTVADTSVLADRERRRFFRVDMELPASVMFRERGPARKLEAKILDMSLSGLRFTADHEFAKDDVVTVVFMIKRSQKDPGKEETLPCRIVRVIEDRGRNQLQYGCEFSGGKGVPSDALCSFLFKKQREFLNGRKKYTNYG